MGSAVEEVTVDEVAALVDDHSLFSEGERATLDGRPDPLPGYAARLAAKRAFAAAWSEAGARLDEAPLPGVEVVLDDGGRPSIALRNGAELPEGIVVHVSLSHDDGVGVAALVIEWRD